MYKRQLMFKYIEDYTVNDVNFFWVLNSHNHVVYILSILLSKYSEVKVSLKPCKTMAYTKLTVTNVLRFIQCI